MIDPAAPLILTLQLDTLTFTRFDELRQQHFPPERNFLPAHLTLFHALPSHELGAITETLAALGAVTPGFPLAFPQLYSLGRGVAIAVTSPPLLALRQQLATTWAAWLTAQDRQRFRPHITIQNKVTAQAAQQLYTQLAEQWEPTAGWAEGLLLWRYLGGPWQLVCDFRFV